MTHVKMRSYRVEVQGFDFRFAYARAASSQRARIIVARAFADAGFGSVREGLAHIVSCRPWPAADNRRVATMRSTDGDEGLLERRTDDDTCPEN